MKKVPCLGSVRAPTIKKKETIWRLRNTHKKEQKSSPSPAATSKGIEEPLEEMDGEDREVPQVEP